MAIRIFSAPALDFSSSRAFLPLPPIRRPQDEPVLPDTPQLLEDLERELPRGLQDERPDSIHASAPLLLRELLQDGDRGGEGVGGSCGDIRMAVGTGSTGNGGDVLLRAGETTDKDAAGGKIELVGGRGSDPTG